MARVLVTHENFTECLSALRSITSGVIAIDTETFGLKWDHKMFALQLAVKGGNSYYFNFLDYPLEIGTDPWGVSVDIHPYSRLTELHDLWRKPEIRWVAHNAKFDMRRLEIEGVHLNGDIYDTMVMAHIIYNKHMSYSLDNCLKRIGLSKNDEVMNWIMTHKAYTTYHVDGKKQKEKDLHFDRVPFDIMFKYGLDDVEDTLKLYDSQIAFFELPENKDQIDLVHNNLQLIKSVFQMESEGIHVDLDYCKTAQQQHNDRVSEIAKYIEELTQSKFKAGPKWLGEVLHAQGIHLPLSDKGNPIMDKKSLEKIPNAIAALVLEMRDEEKHASFYSTFKRFTDRNGVVHPSYRLTGTDTGRFSCSDPNLQQVPKEEKATEAGHTVRGAFYVEDDFILVSIDYDQMEYRLMADYAAEMGMIEAIKGGLDPHTYVANMMGVDRKYAKTLNFGLLYGMGLAKLGESLGVSMDQARELKNRYYSELPKVRTLTRQIMDVAAGRGYIKNYYGRRYFCDDPKWAYKFPNYLIQGTGADIVRHVIPRISYQLEGMKSKLLLQVHDELILKIHRSEVGIVPELKRIMEDEYKPMNGMGLTCGVDFSERTWRTNEFKPWSEYKG